MLSLFMIYEHTYSIYYVAEISIMSDWNKNG